MIRSLFIEKETKGLAFTVYRFPITTFLLMFIYDLSLQKNLQSTEKVRRRKIKNLIIQPLRANIAHVI